MKIRYALQLSAALLLVFLLTASSNLFDKNFAFVGGDTPILPDVPYDYDIEFPEHVLFGPWSLVDSGSVNALISPAGATLGRVLFYDKKLSKSNDLSCASCHKQEFAFADNKQFSDGFGGAVTTRNSPNLNDLIWGASFMFEPPFAQNHPLFWDGRETNLEEMVLQPIVHEGELGKDLDVLLQKLEATDYYAPLFAEAFGTEEITAERIGSAIAQFVRSMCSFESKFDRVMMGQAEFSPEEQLGHDIFIESCGTFCHGEPHFGSTILMNNGLDSIYTDLGLAEWSGNDSDIGKFRSPSLRNIALTAPYMHDGRFATLEEVVDFYSDEVFPHPNNDFGWVIGDPQPFTGFDFDEQQKAALVAFMETLTDESFVEAEKWSDPFQEATGTVYLPLEEEIAVYPNPFKDQALVEFMNSDGDRYVLRLTTLAGQVMKSYETTGSVLLVKKGNLLPGVYLLEIAKDGRKQTKRLVIQ